MEKNLSCMNIQKRTTHPVRGSWDAQLCAAGPLPKDQMHRGPPVSGSLGPSPLRPVGPWDGGDGEMVVIMSCECAHICIYLNLIIDSYICLYIDVYVVRIHK